MTGDHSFMTRTQQHTVPFILASASPRRRDLLQQVALTPDRIIPTDIDESPEPGESPRHMAERLAQAKARAAAGLLNGEKAFILASDTVVACGRRILGKASTEDEARRFLSLLSGRRHRVYTGLCLITPKGRERCRIVETAVIFKRLSEQELELYLKSGEWHDKAGAYAIQGLAARFVKSLNGSYSNVVGLPLFETVNLLEGNGYPVFDEQKANLTQSRKEGAA
tara:strand:- start:30149 stop:30820 length:672 start_codon:yes stop_codon:yes gene_type:complete